MSAGHHQILLSTAGATGRQQEEALGVPHLQQRQGSSRLLKILERLGPHLQQASGSIAQRCWSRCPARGASAGVTCLQQGSLRRVGLAVTVAIPVTS